MFSKIVPPGLDLKDPWKGDLFKRSELANTICSLLKTTSQPSVIGINAPYGFGKTYFLLRLGEQIKNDSGWAVYVNAWEYDYLDNVLFALLDAMKAAAAELGDKKETSKTLKQLGKAAVPAIAKATGKKLLERVVGAEGSKDLAELVADVSGKSAEVLVDRFLKEDTTNTTLNVLREEIRRFVAAHLNAESSYKNLIVIVDELDRARPNYAIRFLETIKHIFGLSQVVFVIGCDRSILISSAQHEYGIQLPTDGYLRRLFDYWIDLPPPRAKEYVSHCAGKLNLLKERIFSNSDSTRDDIEGYTELLLLGRRPEEASLRFIEQSVAHAGVILRLAGTDKQAGLIGWLQGLKQFAPDLYDLYVCNGRISEVYKGLKAYVPFADATQFYQAWIVIWACNVREKLTPDLMKALFGDGQPLYSAIGQIISRGRVDLDERESLAAETDRRMRSVTLRI